MKAYISESELYPCYGVGLKPVHHESIVDAPEEKIRRWRKIQRLFHAAQAEIEAAVRDYEQQQEKIKQEQEDIKRLQSLLNKPNPSRRDKEYVLYEFGWQQIDTSLWRKDGREVRLHDAFNECKREFEDQLSTKE